MEMSGTTIYVQEKTLNQLKDVQKSMHGTTRVPYNSTLDVLFQEKLSELNGGDRQ